MTNLRLSRVLLALGMSAVLAGGAHAAVPFVGNHLKCYKVKDPAAKATYTANLQNPQFPFPAVEIGCTVKVPAKLVCNPVTKVITEGTPPGGDTGPQIHEQIACYKLKCPKGAPTVTMIGDQFGTRQIEAKAPKLLCAPANPFMGS